MRSIKLVGLLAPVVRRVSKAKRGCERRVPLLFFDVVAAVESYRRHRASRHLALLALVVVLNGCFATVFRDPQVPAGASHDEWHSFFAWGLAGHAEIDVRRFCPGDVREVAFGTNGATWLVSTFTLGIYAPEKIYVTCGADPKAARLERMTESAARAEEAAR
jgi:hypothetical protein